MLVVNDTTTLINKAAIAFTKMVNGKLAVFATRFLFGFNLLMSKLQSYCHKNLKNIQI
jgi:hypothetical protein